MLDGAAHPAENHSSEKATMLDERTAEENMVRQDNMKGMIQAQST